LLSELRRRIVEWHWPTIRLSLAVGSAAGLIVAYCVLWVLDARKDIRVLLINSDVTGAAIGVILTVSTSVWIAGRSERRNRAYEIDQSLVHIRALVEALEMVAEVNNNELIVAFDELGRTAGRLTQVDTDSDTTDVYLRVATSSARQVYLRSRGDITFAVGIARGQNSITGGFKSLPEIIAPAVAELNKIMTTYRSLRR